MSDLQYRVERILDDFNTTVHYTVMTLDQFDAAKQRAAAAILAAVRAALLDPEIADDIASEMFLHGYEGDLTQRDTVAPIAVGVIISHLFGECPTCAEGEVRRTLVGTVSHD